MNTVRSSVMGWGSLILAAGVGFYFAKTEINERRQKQAAAGTRPTEKLDWKAKIEQDASETKPSVNSDSVPRSVATAASTNDTKDTKK